MPLSARVLKRLTVVAPLIAGALLCLGPAAARAGDFACPPAPAGWSLDRVPPTSSRAKPGEKYSLEWRAGCLYAELKATVRVNASLTEGGTADADVNWTETAGSCPVPTVNLGSLFSDLKSVDGELYSDSRRAAATYSYEPVDDPFHGAMKPLAAQLLADAEARAGDCTSTKASGHDGGPSDKEIEIAAGLILTLLGGGGLLGPGSGGGGSARREPRDSADHGDPQTHDQPSPPVVTIASPAQGDEVGEYVTVTGTVTGAISVFVTSPGGGGAGAAAGGAFSVSTRVAVQHAAIVVEAVNADGAGRAAVHVFRPGAPEWLPGDDEAHTQALIAQKDAAQAAELAGFQAAVQAASTAVSPTAISPVTTVPAAIVPKSYDELIGHLTSPTGGEVGISAADAPSLLPRNLSWAKNLISDVSINDQVVTVQTPLGSASGTLWADTGGRMIYDPTTIFFDQQMVSKDLADKIQHGLDTLTERIRSSGLRVVDARVEAGRIWIRTGPA